MFGPTGLVQQNKVIGVTGDDDAVQKEMQRRERRGKKRGERGRERIGRERKREMA